MKKFAAIVITLCIMLGISSASAASINSSPLEAMSDLTAIEQILLSYNAEYEWFDELYSHDFSEFALDFMLGDKYADVFAARNDYTLIRCYFANYLSLIQGKTESEMLQLRETLREQGITFTVSQHATLSEQTEVSQESFLSETATLSYDAEAAINYAWDHAYDILHVPYYPSGDCTNFVSQCLTIGGLSHTLPSAVQTGEIYKTTAYWYCRVDYIGESLVVSTSSSYIGTGDFLRYWNAGDDNGKVGRIYATAKAQVYTYARPGDIVLLADSTGVPYHAIIITGRDTEYQDLLYCGHTKARLDASFNEQVSSEDTFYILTFSQL